ncbi:hypothetical protein SI65_05586 [Aspergillus cristatus]|uniref:SMP-30/Gluconolactonase/LRE-like region domain-containing protein n=1 Tax=Aspergillus cristatus TaxID=573508 RepID=A0A1E3BDF9_ASPCR|nr:hypothetical protein SI65_05586 [Aspergillus cristatus]
MFLRTLTFLALLTWALAASVSTLYQFPNKGAFIDNLVIRKNGHILLTRIDFPQVWFVDPFTNIGTVVHDFSYDNSTITSCFGIAEVHPGSDIFAVVTGSFDASSFSSIPGSFEIWKLDVSGREPTVSPLVAIPEAKALSAVIKYGDLLLIADSPDGAIWRVNLRTNEYAKAIEHESMLPAPNAPPMGVNGIRVQNGFLYYASTTREEFRRVAINAHGEAIGSFEIIASGTALDNFDLDVDGTAYMATNAENSITKISPNGKVETIAGGKSSRELPGPTSCVLKGKRLYVGTNGGITAPVDGVFTEQGKIATIQLP